MSDGLKMNKFAKWSLLILSIVLLCVFFFVPSYLDKSMNSITPHEAFEISERASQFHQQLIVADLHSDSTLWKRDLLEAHDFGHMDVPRLLKGNVTLQMFTTVTKVPSGINYEKNSAEASDSVTRLAMVQAWPVQTWTSLLERALYQAKKVRDASHNSPNLMLINNKKDLADLLRIKKSGQAMVGAMIGTEGSHALEGSTLNIKKMFDAGFRMMSLQHFFDNRLGGSLHGESGQGLTEFGKSALEEMERLRIIVDVSHSSTAVVADVLDIATRPVVVSHTGVFGHCPNKRNIPDQLMQRIAAKGGLVAIGHWDGAVCKAEVDEIIKALRYAIDLLGEDRVALGSDFDGATQTAFDTAELSVLTDRMLKAGFTNIEIQKVMGLNTVRFFQAYLPE